MTSGVGIFRNKTALLRAVDAVRDLTRRCADVRVPRSGRAFDFALADALELEGMLDLAGATALAASLREESRGSHFRTDHPARDDANWLLHSVARRGADGIIGMSWSPPLITKWQPRERTY
jgi:succinate dehydrogenase/fumarate reductase flavoprotein subunit